MRRKTKPGANVGIELFARRIGFKKDEMCYPTHFAIRHFLLLIYPYK
jgi:hypothetical protein